jgi:hypothetical protein
VVFTHRLGYTGIYIYRPFIDRLGPSPPRDDGAVKLICAASDDNAVSAVMLVIGAVMLVLCMVLMLMSLSSSLALNSMQRKQGRNEKKRPTVESV